jgi:hypothetical protein
MAKPRKLSNPTVIPAVTSVVLFLGVPEWEDLYLSSGGKGFGSKKSMQSRNLSV